MRYLSLISLVLLVEITCPAWGHNPVPNGSREAAKPVEAKDCDCSKARNGYPWPPCHCIQQLWLDYPGPNDLYICLTYLENCEDDGEEEMWFGEPSNQYRPQICQYNQCEEYVARGNTRGLPGHGLPLTASIAWRMAEQGLKSAKRKTPKLEWGDPQYHQIPQARIPEGFGVTDDMLVMAVPIKVNVKNSPLNGKTVHLCIEIDSAKDQDSTPAEMEDGEQGTGRQFRINYKVNGEERRGLVWLK